MDGYIAILIGVVAAIAGLALLYANRNVTFPGHEGQGEVWFPVIAAAGAVGLVWLLGLAAGTSNIFLDVAVSLRFGLQYDDTLVKFGTWIAVLGLSFLAGVVSYNMARHGRAIM